MNPYKFYADNYTDFAKNNMYACVKDTNSNHIREYPPHPWGIAAQSMWQLMQQNAQNQAICISGESGAGKTYAAKDCINFITGYNEKLAMLQQQDGERRQTVKRNSLRASSIHKGDTQVEKKGISLEDRILGCSPLLEALGNAKTIRNDNSSRFGKYMTLYVEDKKIVGADNRQYLLEAVRVTDPNVFERNYHVFYQLIVGAPDELIQR